MNSDFERSAAADLQALVAAIAGSPILVARTPAPFLPDWEKLRKSSDVDAVVLAWIASHVRGAHRRLAH